MDGRGRYHVTSQKLKNWVLEDVRSSIGLGAVDNTSDLMKPLSLIQEPIIDSKINTLRRELVPRLNELTSKKADLVNGVVPLTQIPLKLRDDTQVLFHMSDLVSDITRMLDNLKITLNSEQIRLVSEHALQADPHSIKPYVDEAVLSTLKTVDSLLDSLKNNLPSIIEEVLVKKTAELTADSTMQDLLTAIRLP